MLTLILFEFPIKNLSYKLSESQSGLRRRSSPTHSSAHWPGSFASPQSSLSSSSSSRRMISIPQPLSSRKSRPSGPRLLDRRPREVAEQLTLLDSSIFCSITLPELYRVRWKSENRAEVSANVVRLIDRFEMISSWVGTSILLLSDSRDRVVTIEFFIRLAWAARKLRNFSLLYATFTGLVLDPVQQQVEAWEQVSERLRSHLDVMRNMLSIRRNYREYRSELVSDASNLLATIPYLGLVLKDLVAAEENMSDRTDDGMLNVEKMLVVGRILDRVLFMQQFSFRIVWDPDIQSEIERMTWIASEELGSMYSREQRT